MDSVHTRLTSFIAARASYSNIRSAASLVRVALRLDASSTLISSCKIILRSCRISSEAGNSTEPSNGGYRLRQIVLSIWAHSKSFLPRRTTGEFLSHLFIHIMPSSWRVLRRHRPAHNLRVTHNQYKSATCMSFICYLERNCKNINSMLTNTYLYINSGYCCLLFMSVPAYSNQKC